MRVLDAGCGAKSVPRDGYVVGLDIDEQALQRNPRLDERIVGNLETYPLPRDSFDLIVCSDVLEHMPRPELALENMIGALAPGGVLELGFPNLLTLKGLVTKFTPHWFHRWVYQHVYKNTVDEPYKTYLRASMRPAAVVRLARRCGLLVDEHCFESGLHPLAWRSECRMRLRRPA